MCGTIAEWQILIHPKCPPSFERSTSPSATCNCSILWLECLPWSLWDLSITKNEDSIPDSGHWRIRELNDICVLFLQLVICRLRFENFGKITGRVDNHDPHNTPNGHCFPATNWFLSTKLAHRCDASRRLKCMNATHINLALLSNSFFG